MPQVMKCPFIAALGVDTRRPMAGEADGTPLMGLLVDIPIRFDGAQVKADGQALVDALMAIVLGLESKWDASSSSDRVTTHSFFRFRRQHIHQRASTDWWPTVLPSRCHC